MNASGYALFDEDLGPGSTDNTHLSSRPKLEALPLLIYTLGKESFRGSEEPVYQKPPQDPNRLDGLTKLMLMDPYTIN